MQRFKNILLVADFDTRQQMAVDRAVSLARQNEAQLTVLAVVKELPADLRMAVTVLSPGELLELVMSDYRNKVDALVADIDRSGIDAKSQVVSGSPFVEIIRKVLRDEHDLVILAADGTGGVRERLLGSTSMHLMRKCPCPVWVVKSAKRTSYRQILAAVDTTNDSPDSDRESLNPLILQLASFTAQMDNSDFRVVQVWSMIGEQYIAAHGQLGKIAIDKMREETKREFARKLDSLLADVDLQGVVVHKHLPRSDNVARTIVKLATNKKIELLVMGTVCRTGLAGFFIGNTAETVLSEVNCSVLTVKPEGFVTPVTLDDA